MPVTVYMSPDCIWSARAIELLRQRGVPFVLKNVKVDKQASEEMVRRSGQRGVPVIATDSEVIVGFDQKRLERLQTPPTTTSSPATVATLLDFRVDNPKSDRARCPVCGQLRKTSELCFTARAHGRLGLFGRIGEVATRLGIAGGIFAAATTGTAAQTLAATPPPAQGIVRPVALVPPGSTPVSAPRQFQPFWVRNHLMTGLWSAPTPGESTFSFGETSLKFCVFEVVAPAEGDRWFVRNPYSRTYVWMDEPAIGPVGPPDTKPEPAPVGLNCAEDVYRG